ncbi:MAG: epimerase [Pseudomonadota bacterium]
MENTVLILGGKGRFGRHATNAFAYAGWNVRQFNRATDSLWDAAWGAQVIVNAWNMPPGAWKTEAVKAHQEVSEVAAASGATVILPGNVYNYGASMPPLLRTDTPHAAQTIYGKVRVELEAAYRDAGARIIVLRAGDFLDTEASGNWFDRIMIASLDKGVLTYPGPLDRPHAWAFLPDVARAAVRLADIRDTLPVFADIPYAGLTMTGTEMAEALTRVTGREVKAKPMGWAALRLLSPFWDVARYANDMRYLWEVPHALDPAPLKALLPDHRDSDASTALAAALELDIDPDRVMPGKAGVSV